MPSGPKEGAPDGIGIDFRASTDGRTPAEPPTLTTVAPLWRPGDTIPLGRRTLRVVEVQESNGEHPTVLVVQDMSG
jgi:hypothetical protein